MSWIIWEGLFTDLDCNHHKSILDFLPDLDKAIVLYGDPNMSVRTARRIFKNARGLEIFELWSMTFPWTEMPRAEEHYRWTDIYIEGYRNAMLSQIFHVELSYYILRRFSKGMDIDDSSQCQYFQVGMKVISLSFLLLITEEN